MEMLRGQQFWVANWQTMDCWNLPLQRVLGHDTKVQWLTDPHVLGTCLAPWFAVHARDEQQDAAEFAGWLRQSLHQALAREHFQKHVSALVDKSVASFKEFQESLQTKDPEKAQAICQVQLDNPFYRPKGGSHFLCSRCGRTAQLCVFRKLRCQKSPIDIRQQDFCRFACGDKFADYQIAWNAEKWKKTSKETGAVPKRKSAPAKRNDAVAKSAPVKCKPKSSKSR